MAGRPAALERLPPLVAVAVDGGDEVVAGHESEALEHLRTQSGSTVIVVTHSARVAGAADRVVEMHDGAVVT